MKFPIATAVAALTMAAATTGFAQSQPSAAATLPDAFENPASPAQPAQPARPAQAPAAPTATAPDIARSEAALRTVIANFQSGQVDYTSFTTDLGEQVRGQADMIGSLLTQFGAVQSVTHKGQPQGADMFEVQFENQKTEWVIGFDNEDQIAALLFRPAEN